MSGNSSCIINETVTCQWQIMDQEWLPSRFRNGGDWSHMNVIIGFAVLHDWGTWGKNHSWIVLWNENHCYHGYICQLLSKALSPLVSLRGYNHTDKKIHNWEITDSEKRLTPWYLYPCGWQFATLSIAKCYVVKLNHKVATLPIPFWLPYSATSACKGKHWPVAPD